MKRLLLLLIVITLAACGSSGSTPDYTVPPAADYSGTYHIIFSGEPNWTMTVTQTDADVDATLAGSGMTIVTTGDVSGNRVTLSADVTDMGTMTIVVQFSGDAQAFSGTYAFSSPGYISGTLIGQASDWTTYDASGGLPKFVEDEYIAMANIDRLSRFRSAAGHDYSDEFESCRSMKHYYVPDSLFLAWDTIAIYSPAATKVMGIEKEYIDSTPAGYKLLLESIDNPGIYFTIFHMTPSTVPAPGDTYAAGQQIGTHMGTLTSSDIAVGIYNAGSSWTLVSFFDVMTAVFFTSNYMPNANIIDRSDLIITATERDADPLACDGETFIGFGSLEDYVTLGLTP